MAEPQGIPAEPATAAEGEAMRPSQWLMVQARRARGAVAATVAIGVVDAALVIAQAVLIAWIIHAAVVERTPVAELMLPFTALAGVLVARAVATWGRAAAGALSAQRITRAVRRDLYRHLAALGPARLQAHHSGSVAGALVEQVEALESYYANFLPQMVLAVVVPLTLITVVFLFDPWAGLLLLLATPLVPLFMALVGAKAGRRAQAQQQSFSRISAHFLDRLRGLATLRIFRAEARAAAAVEAAADEYRARSMAVLRVAFLSSAALELIAAVSIAVVAVYVGLSLLGQLPFGPGPELGLYGGLVILLLAPEVFLPLRRLAVHYHDRATAVGAAEQIAVLLNDPAPALQPQTSSRSAVARDPHNDLPIPTPASLRYRDVEVAFGEGSPPVLSAIDLQIGAGERVVICGESGAGKSTLLHLAAGFMAPTAGRVEVAGTPAPGAAGIAWVGQRPWLFHGTVADNLRLADPQAPAQRLWAALQIADLATVIESLPEGLDAPLGDDGFGLSGGQASRLALARALLSGAPLLLLDEPTAGLDPESTERVLAALEQLADGRRTLVMVAHDAAAQAWGERRIVIEAGRVKEDRRA